MKIKRIAIDESARRTLLESAGKDSGLTMESVNQIADFLETSMNSKIGTIGRTLKAEMTKKISAQYKKLAREAVARHRKQLVQKMDMYLEHVVKDWYKKNQTVVEASVSTVQNRRIVEGVMQVLESNYVGLSGKQKEAFAALTKYTSRVERVAESNKSIAEKNRRLAVSAQKRAVVEFAARNLTATQREKLLEMTSSIKASNFAEFKKKVSGARHAITENRQSFAPRKTTAIVEQRQTAVDDKENDLISRSARLI